MLIYYLKLFRESYWPGGELAKPNPPRSDEEKLRRRKLAKEKLLQNIPGNVSVDYLSIFYI